MPVSIVVGGQFGSEGKGKISLEIVRRDPRTAAVVRVGGTNSGHTAVDRHGITHVLRQMPAGAVDGNVQVILPPGSFIDVDIFHREVQELGFDEHSIAVSPMARVITSEHIAWEANSGLTGGIGSTQSGTGAAVLASVARGARNMPLASVQAVEISSLASYLRDTDEVLYEHLNAGKRIVIEGTQGFGLSVLHGGYWPKATSRDTTAAGFLSEAGLSPLDVDDITIVLRSFPIRVAGDSGPLVGETSWAQIASQAKLPADYKEYTSVTKRVRRVGAFDAELVRRAILANRPTRIVLNHLDYVDPDVRTGALTELARKFVDQVEGEIGQKIDWLGIGPAEVITLSNRQMAS